MEDYLATILVAFFIGLLIFILVCRFCLIFFRLLVGTLFWERQSHAYFKNNVRLTKEEVRFGLKHAVVMEVVLFGAIFGANYVLVNKIDPLVEPLVLILAIGAMLLFTWGLIGLITVIVPSKWQKIK